MNEQTGGSQPEQSAPSRSNRRPSRPRRRGGQGRSRDLREPASASQTIPATPPDGTGAPPLNPSEPARAVSARISSSHSTSSRETQQARTPRSPIGQAIGQVEEIIKTLRDSLRELEDVLETLDDAQRQQIGDEKEIESLRRSLSFLQRERTSGPREPARGRSDEGRSERGRFENRNRAEERPHSEPSPRSEESPGEDSAGRSVAPE